MRMRTGQARDYRQSLNGSALRRITQSKEILSRTRIFTQPHLRPQETIDHCTNCLAMFGNGPAAPTRPTPAIVPRRAHLANTTESSCATSTFCVAVPAPPRAVTFAVLIAISSNQKNAGSLQGSDSRAIHSESVGHATTERAPNDNAIMTANSLTAVQPASGVPPATSDLLSDVIAGLSSDPRTLPCKYFYDERGAALFQKICELPEYYITRTELDILDRHRAEIASQLGPNIELIGLGTGAGTKTRILVEALEKPAAYIPVDISEKQLRKSSAIFRKIFPHLEVLPVCADYLQTVVLPSLRQKAARNVVYFPGSTIGNFEPNEALEFLRRIANVSGRGGGLLIGVDLQKDQNVIEAAYNDKAGVTAQFNLNLLAHINRETGANFDLSRWQHRAIYNSEAGRIEMYLISATDQTVRIQERQFHFRAGEKILTEHSYKHTPEGFIALARQAGFDFVKLWTDDARLFGVFYFSCSRDR